MSKKVSIIVISYNAKDDLKECLNSLGAQDYDDKEIVVVNDASTDDTLEFLQQYQNQTDVDLVVINNKMNLGVAGARNVGIKHSSGEIIAFTDADCVADFRWVSELIKGYNHKDVVAVAGKVYAKRITNIWELSEKGRDFVASKEGYVYHVVGCNMSFSNSVLTKFMFNDEIKYGYEEWLLCDYLINDGYKIYYRPQAVVHHKHRSTLAGSLRRKYLLGVSSIWYRKKQKKLLMFKRHIIFLAALIMAFLSQINYLFLYLSLAFFLVFAFSLLRDEILFGQKTIREIIITFPFLILIEFSHFSGSFIGLIKFRILETSFLKKLAISFKSSNL